MYLVRVQEHLTTSSDKLLQRVGDLPRNGRSNCSIWQVNVKIVGRTRKVATAVPKWVRRKERLGKPLLSQFELLNRSSV